MGSSSAEIDVSIRDYVAEKRRMRGDHPKVFELAAYHDGELANAERESIRDHLAICPECTRLILDRSLFAATAASREDSDPAEDDILSEDDMLSEDDIEEQKQALRARIRQQAGPVAEVLPFPDSLALTKPSESSVHRVRSAIPWWYHTAAAALLVASFGLGFWAKQFQGTGDGVEIAVGGSSETPGTLINVYPVTLRSVEDVFRGANPTNEIQAPPEYPLMLFLPIFQEDFPTYAEYRVEILGQAGQRLWKHDGFQPTNDQFSLEFPRQLRQAGSYQVHLYGLADGQPEHLTQYDMVIKDAIVSDEAFSEEDRTGNGVDPPS